ncbi:uncharacterized protein LOC119708479 isoform X2 [Motacilla alba alba]|nr:uncharacterized protein LOC119708479 isoform X2 [Motacilla alba alba]
MKQYSLSSLSVVCQTEPPKPVVLGFDSVMGLSLIRVTLMSLRCDTGLNTQQACFGARAGSAHQRDPSPQKVRKSPSGQDRPDAPPGRVGRGAPKARTPRPPFPGCCPSCHTHARTKDSFLRRESAPGGTRNSPLELQREPGAVLWRAAAPAAAGARCRSGQQRSKPRPGATSASFPLLPVKKRWGNTRGHSLPRGRESWEHAALYTAVLVALSSPGLILHVARSPARIMELSLAWVANK